MSMSIARFPRAALFCAASALAACGAAADAPDADAPETGARAQALSPTGIRCQTSGAYTTGWLYAGGLDFARANLSWSGESLGSSGSMTVTATLLGLSYEVYDSLSATGVIRVNGRACGTASFVDRSPPDGAVTITCTVPVTQSLARYAITVSDSAAGARWEFIRGGVNNQFHYAVSVTQGNGSTYCQP
jgi:hypothetical protein